MELLKNKLPESNFSTYKNKAIPCHANTSKMYSPQVFPHGDFRSPTC